MTTSIQTDALLAEFATLAYKDEAFLKNSSNLPSGWEFLKSDDKPPFAAFAFQHTTTNQVIISYRGTDGVSDVGADIAITMGAWHTVFAGHAVCQKHSKPVRRQRTGNRPQLGWSYIAGGVFRLWLEWRNH